ncbi:GNAT family N-acetyltransferase [Streptomyces avermitilis]
MSFRWDVIERVMPVPYVPTLGPVRPGSPLPELFAAVVAAASTGPCLPHDKDRRWSDRKAERVLVDTIEHDRPRTLIPTFLERGAGTVRVHVYGEGLDGVADLARQLADAHGAARARVVSFLGPGEPEERAQGGTRVQYKDFTAGAGPAPGGTVLEAAQLPETAGFAEFADTMASHGFVFLHERIRAGIVGPVLVVRDGGRVAGAIGPMETMADATGAVRLLPQYFGVLPELRGRDHGRNLWRAAMHWGRDHGADYQLLQTEVGGASDRLCTAEGLLSLGVVHQAEA